ncbi:hypothetical protein SOCE26_021600 [Sorangium cellulosum]|uniref:Secreted protein n=1 Tax=Sorangium cellulosum TaxID=56 RepID=A0A2L0EN90_SORCE|nr:hypothetical protein [Sorangium cellulosum]AUX40759.1 hypothetical protein SOCE26_021600 [Sorangium cellulosum]
MRSIALAAAVCAGALTLAPACDRGAPPVPETSDPTGKDLVVGAVVAATEKSGGVRLYKIVEVEDMPEPFGRDLHMIAYEPKAKTFQEAAELRRKGGMTVLHDHMMVRLVNFMKRDHRVISHEPISDEERAPYAKSLNSRQR